MKWLSFLFLLAAIAFAQIPLTGRVIDQVHLLSDSAKQKLETVLEQHEKVTSNQIVVLIIPSLNGQPIEEFGYQQARWWGLGKKEKNNGVLLLVALKERQVRIEVGYGLEAVLTDAEGKLIIERFMLPYFREGEMEQGILEGTDAIVKALKTDTDLTKEKPKESQSDLGDLVSTLFTFGVISLIIFFVWLGRFSGGNRRGPRGPFGGGFRGRFGGGGGSFSGGGGSFGGGGASGKW